MSHVASTSISPEYSLVEIVNLLENGEPTGMKALHGLVHRGVRFFFVRNHDKDAAEDMAHDVLLEVVNFIRRGKLKEPNALLGLVWTIARRRHIYAMRKRKEEGTVVKDGSEMMVESDSFERVQRYEQVEIAERVLREMPSRGREILVRYYLKEQTPEQICADMGITETQFRLMKWRAKARFAELGKEKLARAAVTSAPSL
jgi:RNA polymerase sigma factor (sigma-70 family)